MVEVAAIVLAAGRATRFAAGGTEGESKVLARLDGRPLLAHVVATVLASAASPVIVVTGRDAARVVDLLRGLAVACVHNPRFEEGMAGSIAAGVAAVPDTAEAALILLADMPRVATATLDQLVAVFERDRPDAVVPIHDGRRGNPVLLSRSLFPALQRLTGDQGARQILADGAYRVSSCPVSDPGVLVDIDTRAALDALARNEDYAASRPTRRDGAGMSVQVSSETLSSISRAESGGAKK